MKSVSRPDVLHASLLETTGQRIVETAVSSESVRGP
ncbi:hypothetical protein PC117_g10022 [Phytophthora cactorum]|uniref:Uncharacterized protein n=1 Tax=Phytophthora cactorum TaxID=29920 RepID=A0A8T1DLA1_9STRA|nr:hypothetical protein PC117_g10022 [Phytophthora cactorum]